MKSSKNTENDTQKSGWNQLDTFTKAMAIILTLLVISFLIYNVYNHNWLRQRSS